VGRDRRREPAARPAVRADCQRRHPGLPPERHFREPDAGPDRLDPERDHVPRSDVGGRNQCRVRAARRGQTASL